MPCDAWQCPFDVRLMTGRSWERCRRRKRTKRRRVLRRSRGRRTCETSGGWCSHISYCPCNPLQSRIGVASDRGRPPSPPSEVRVERDRLSQENDELRTRCEQMMEQVAELTTSLVRDRLRENLLLVASLTGGRRTKPRRRPKRLWRDLQHRARRRRLRVQVSGVARRQPWMLMSCGGICECDITWCGCCVHEVAVPGQRTNWPRPRMRWASRPARSPNSQRR
jgi:hypothetical protein